MLPGAVIQDTVERPVAIAEGSSRRWEDRRSAVPSVPQPFAPRCPVGCSNRKHFLDLLQQHIADQVVHDTPTSPSANQRRDWPVLVSPMRISPARPQYAFKLMFPLACLFPWRISSASFRSSSSGLIQTGHGQPIAIAKQCDKSAKFLSIATLDEPCSFCGVYRQGVRHGRMLGPKLDSGRHQLTRFR